MKHPKELHPRRFVFHAHASGVAAHIRRPKDAVLGVQSCSVLPVIGGHCESKVGKTKLGKWVSFDSAFTSAYGDYVSKADGVATTRGKPFDQAPTITRVDARVRGLSILGRVRIDDLVLHLESRSPRDPGQPPIRLAGNRIDGVTIDGCKLKITLAEAFFKKHDTKDKLKGAFGELASRHAGLFLPAHPDVEEVTDFPEAENGYVKCTIVQKIAWDGNPHPTAQIYGHVVRVPNFGKIYFGELFVNHDSRRLTLVRFQLGSDDGGEVTGGDGQTNGNPYPPGGG